MQNSSRQTYSFDGFSLDLLRGCLLREGQEVKLRPKSFEALKFLVEHPRRLISKEELIQALWPDSFVTDGSLVQCLRDVRLALGDEEQKYLKTVPRRGYIFIADVIDAAPATATPGADVVAQAIEQRISAATGQPAEVPANPKPSTKHWPWSYRNLLVAIILIALLGAFLFWRSTNQSGQSGAATAARTIAVLPFKSLNAERGADDLGLGMADTLITRLGNFKRLIVRPITAVHKYAAREQDVLAAGREQQVEVVLEGSLQRAGEKIRVTARLWRVADGQALWAGEFEERLTEPFAVQDALSHRIIESLALSLTGGEKKFPVRPELENSPAYQLYRQGRYFWNKRTEAGYYKAIEYFNQAIQADPNYALAHAGLADTWHLLGDYSFLPPRETFPKATEAALNAIKLDDSLAEAHTALAYAKFLYDWDWTWAEWEFQRAIDLDPSYPTAHQWYSEYLAAQGRFSEAQATLQRALVLDPASPILNAEQGWLNYIARDYERAIKHCRKAIDLEANFYPAHFWLGQACEKKELYREAIAAYEKALTLSGGSPEVLASLGHAYAAAGEHNKAQKQLDELRALSARRYVSPYFIALVYAGLNDQPRTLAALQNAVADRARAVPFLKVDPMFEHWRAEADFIGLLQRARLAQ